jgi:dephospho-CoA kinase
VTKIAIIGAPRCGKSTFASKLAKRLGIDLLSTGKRALVATDNFIGVPWESVPDAVLDAVRGKDDWIIEGCQTARVLRRWLREDPERAKELTKVYYFDRPFVKRTSGQEAMGKGIAKVWSEVRPVLIRAGVEIQYGVPDDQH